MSAVVRTLSLSIRGLVDKGAVSIYEKAIVINSDLEFVDFHTPLVGHVCMSHTFGKGYGVQMEFRQLLMPLLFLNTTESDLLEEIIWYVCVIK